MQHFLRHTVATLAYRGGKTVREVPENFATFRLHDSTRTPLEILAHINDLLDWSLRMADGITRWTTSNPATWDEETSRFFDLLAQLDTRLGNETPLGQPAEQIFQGPIADALTHVGQLAMMRRVAGAPIRAENYFKANIHAGS
ncbi:MAG TPA: hypothetical protein VM733_17045 [Thermoanaerobaculia bacterium]|nr:hypothetical protein [Thermoanaerobaculia bacterium]